MSHILYWNAVALDANRRDFTDIPATPPGCTEPRSEQGGPTLSSRALAIVHLAMYDAHAGARGNPASLPAYLPGLPGANGGSPEAAVAGAAHRVLSELYPRQKAHFDDALMKAALPTAPATTHGLAFGAAVADAMLADRGGDPGAGDTGHVHSNDPGRHRPDPVKPQGSHAPWYGKNSKCFAVKDRHTLDKPYSSVYKPNEYARAVRQVRGKGIAAELMGTLPAAYGDTTKEASKRTPDETVVGLYWAYDGARNLGTPPRLYNLIAREVAKARNTGASAEDENARLFALVNAAMGDAGILAWDDKYHYDVWRPVVGIREHDGSMGPMAPAPGDILSPECDPEWRPLGAPDSNQKDGLDFTPPFPAYPSGHATFGAAALHMIRLFYGVKPGNVSADNVYQGPFVSEELNGATTDSQGVTRAAHARRFPGGLWQMIIENGFSRVYLGVHWFFDAFALKPTKTEPDLSKFIGGVPLGLRIAEDIWAYGNRKAPKKSMAGPRT